ncbi:MAG TPA: hypothetical protein VLN42_03670 [Casimicrobiaceae bacterium]|nr:hypothetical protein [Casimicrobiaceae bacterium]
MKRVSLGFIALVIVIVIVAGCADIPPMEHVRDHCAEPDASSS